MPTQTISPSGTTFVSSALANINFSVSTSIVTGVNPIYSRCISFLQFEIPSLPVTSVDSAILRLFVLYKTGISPTPVVVNRTTSAFDIATVTYNTMPPLEPTASTIDVNLNDVSHFVEIDVTALVNQWLSGTFPNNGIALTNPAGISEVQFGSNTLNPAFRPQLVINFSSSPAVLAGIQAQLQGSPATIIADGANVVFDTVLINQSPGISYNNTTGEFTISTPGNYYVAWWVAADGTEGPVNVVFSVTVDGTPVALGNVPAVTSQVNGDALITVGAAPAVVTLENQTGASVLFANIPVQANITIFSV